MDMLTKSFIDVIGIFPTQPCNEVQRCVYHTVGKARGYFWVIIPRPYSGALSDDARLTSVCLSRTSGLSREQRDLGRLKFAQRKPQLRHKFQGLKVKVTGGGGIL